LFYNLLSNSLKFTKNDTSPVIEIISEAVHPVDLKKYALDYKEENYIRIIIKDNGIGFGVNETEKIFKTFSRLHSKDQFEGTGLGLHM